MSEPIDYASPLARAQALPTPDLGGALLGGVNQALQMNLLQAQQQHALQAQQLATQAQTRALANPTPDNILAWGIADPQHFQAAQSAHTAKNSDQQRQDVQDAASVYGYLQAGDTDGAAAIVQKRVDAGQGNLAPLLGLIKTDPKKAQAAAGLTLAGFMGPDKFGEAYKAVGEESRANAELPGKMALTAAQTEQAKASALKDSYIPVNTAEGQDLLHIGGGGPAAGGAAPGGSSPSASAPAPTIPGPAGQVVAQTAQKVGATPDDMDYLARTAALESRGDPNAQNGSSTGIFQLQPKTFAGVGGTDIKSVAQQTVGALRLKRQNAVALRGMLGHDATADQLYLAHQQGATGAAALISADPNTNAITALTQTGVSPAKAKASIVNNGGDENTTAGQFVQQWRAAYQQGGLKAAEQSGASGEDQQPELGPGVSVAYKSKAGGDMKLDPAAVDYVAQQYISTGQLPPMGNGKVATLNRNAVINRAQQIEAETGATGYDAVARHAAMKTAQSNLTQISGVAQMVKAAEGTVEQNMHIVMALAPKGGGPTGSPLLNAPIQALRKNVWGSDKVAQFDGALGTVADEYAKVMTSATGSGGGPTSDSARQEAYSRLSKASTLGQLQGVMTTMRQEMANRSAQLEAGRAEQLAVLGSRGGSPQGRPQAAPAASPPSGQRLSPQQAQALAPGTPFIGLDGVPRVRH